MFPVDPINGHAYFGAGTPAKKSDLDLSTFLRLLTVQLLNQNPLEPMGDRDFFAQLAQLGQVQGMDKIQESLDTSQAASLIGKEVTAVRPFTQSGEIFDSLVTGTVVRMSVVNGERILGIREDNGGIVEVKMGNIREISS